MRLSGLGATCYSVDQIYQIAVNAGFPSDAASTMAAIAMAESGGCPGAYNGGNPPGAESSYGLFQINTKGNPTLLAQLGLSDVSQLFDPAVNGSAAYRLWSTSGFAPWSVYNSGAYTAFLQDPPVAYDAASGFPLDSTGVIDMGMMSPQDTMLAVGIGAAILLALVLR